MSSPRSRQVPLRLTLRQRGIVDAVNALRAVPQWQAVFTAEGFEADMLEAIEGRNVAKMARVGVAFLTRVCARDAVEKLDGQHEARARGGRNSAGKRGPSAYRKLLEQFERDVLKAPKSMTRSSPLLLRQKAARWIGCRIDYVTKLLKDRDARPRLPD